MFKRIMVPLDGSPFSEAALGHAAVLAKAFDAEILIVHVLVGMQQTNMIAAESPELMTQLENSANRGAEKYLDGKIQSLRQAGYNARPIIGTGSSIAQVVVEAAEREKVDTIVMTSHGFSGLNRLVFGSVAQRVARLAPMPVLLIKPE